MFKTIYAQKYIKIPVLRYVYVTHGRSCSLCVDKSARSIGPRRRHNSDRNINTATPHAHIRWACFCSSQYEKARSAAENVVKRNGKMPHQYIMRMIIMKKAKNKSWVLKENAINK